MIIELDLDRVNAMLTGDQAELRDLIEKANEQLMKEPKASKDN